MDPVKIIFFDIDGTLVDPATGQIPASTREALSRLHENGLLLCIATGRPPASLPNLAGLHFDAFCTFNGSLCYTETETIHSNPLPCRAVAKILENTAALGKPISVATRHRLAANGWEQDLAEYYRLAGLELTVDENFEAACREDVYQLMVGCREAEHPAIIRDAEGADITFSWHRAADVIPAGSSKGKAILKILDHYRLTPAQAMAFGDGFNDIEMLQTVGTGIAMGNADPRLKAVAKEQCLPVNQDGIYHYCLTHGLI